MKTKRWVLLDQDQDQKIKELADQEARSIAGMLRYIITKYLNESQS